jgi:hypothetical protein
MKDTDAFSPQENIKPAFLPKLFSKLGRFSYTVHNTIGHPIAEIFWILGFHKVGDYIHDITVPNPDTKES